MTTQQSISVNVDIYGQQYKIKGHSNAEYMKMIAQSIDESMIKLAKSYPILDTHKLAVLTAVQVSEEVFRLRKENSRLELEEERLSLTIKQLEEMQQKIVDAQKLLDSYKHQAAITLDEVKLQYEQQFSELNQQQTQIIAELKAEHELQQSLQTETFASEIELVKANYQETVELLQTQLTEVTEAHQAELTLIIANAEQDKKQAVVQIKSKLETDLAKQKVDYETLVKAYEDYRTKADEQVRLLEETLVSETDELKQLHELELLDINEQHEQQSLQLNNQINELTTRYTSQVNALDLEIVELKEQLVELSQAKEVDLSIFEQRLMQADEQLIKALETESNLNDTIAQLEAVKLNLSEEFSDKLDVLGQELELEKESNIELSNALTEVQTALDILRLESEQQLAETKAQLVETETYLLTSQQQTDQYKQKTEQQEQELGLLQNRLKEQDLHIQELNAKLDDQEQLIRLADDTLNEQLRMSKESLDRVEQNARTIQQEQEKLIEKLKADYATLWSEKEVSEQTNKLMYDELLVEFEQMNAQKQQFELAQTKAFKELEHELEHQLSAKTELATRFEQELSDKTADADVLAQHLKTKLEQEDEWLLQLEIKEEELASIGKQLADKAIHVDVVQSQLAEKMNQLEATALLLVEKDNLIERFEQQLESKLAETSAVTIELTQLKQTLSTLEEQHIQLEIQKEELEQELRSVQEQLDEKLKENQATYELQGQLLVAHKHLADVESQRTVLLEKHKVALAKSEELLQYLEMSAAKERLFENEKLLLNEELLILQSKLQSFEAEKIDLGDELTRKQSELHYANEQIGLYESQMAQLEAAAASSAVDEDLSEQLLGLEEQLQQLQHEHQKLQTEYSKLQTEYNEWIALLD